MCRPERKTLRRRRPPPLRAICVRTRRSRRAKRSVATRMAILLLLAFLADDEFLLVLDALALVGLRLAEGADLGRNLADPLLVGTRNGDRGRLLALDRDVRRDRILDVVAVAQLQHQLLALDRRAVADAVDLQVPAEALGHALHQVARQVAGGAPHHARLLGLADRLHLDRAILDGDLDLGGERQLELAKLALRDEDAFDDLGGDAGGDRHRILSYAGHRL